MPANARNPHPLTDPIHFPSPKRVETQVVLPDPTAWSFPITTDDTSLHYSGIDVQGPHDPDS